MGQGEKMGVEMNKNTYEAMLRFLEAMVQFGRRENEPYIADTARDLSLALKSDEQVINNE